MKRCDVYLMMTKKVYNSLLEELKADKYIINQMNPSYELITEQVHAKHENEKYIALTWSHIKWGRQYQSCEPIIDYLHSLSDKLFDLFEYEKASKNEDLYSYLDRVSENYAWKISIIHEDGRIVENDFSHSEFDYADYLPELCAYSTVYNQLNKDEVYIVKQTVYRDEITEVEYVNISKYKYNAIEEMKKAIRRWKTTLRDLKQRDIDNTAVLLTNDDTEIILKVVKRTLE